MKCLLALPILLVAVAAPAQGASQSSNSSSNCSNGRCTIVQSYTVEDRGRVRGWRRVEVYDERRRPSRERRERRWRERW